MSQDFRVTRRSQGSDAAAARRRGTFPCARRSELQPRLLHAAPRSRNDHSVFAANQGFTVSHVSSTKLRLIHYTGCSEKPQVAQNRNCCVLHTTNVLMVACSTTPMFQRKRARSDLQKIILVCLWLRFIYYSKRQTRGFKCTF